MAEAPPHAVLAAFASSREVLDAARRVRALGYSHVDAFTPYPVDGLAEAIGYRDRRTGGITLAGGIAGLAIGLAIQIGANLDYPLRIGGRPLLAPSEFVVIAFATMILGAALAAVIGMLVRDRLPRLNHPLFDAPGFGFDSDDRFFLAIFGDDPAFDRDAVGKALAALKPCAILEAPGGRQAE